MSDDGPRVGSAHIEITPELNKAALNRFKKDIKTHLEEMGKAADKSLRDSQKDLMGSFQKEMKAFQQGKTKAVFEQHRAEIQSFQRLQKQKENALASEEAKRQKYFEAEKRRIADSVKAAKQLAEQREKGLKAAADRELQNRYLDMRRNGATPSQAASEALGRNIKGGDLVGRLAQVEAASKRSSASMAKAFDVASHHLSQLSTRIGLASFQLQLLGGFATTFLTGPAGLMFGKLASDGLKFAVSIDYARASMKSLLGPGTDVEKILADIRRMAIESPLFNTEDAISYAQKLAAVGVKGGDLYKSMQALSNIFLTQGVAGPERAQLALMAYTQILSKGAIGMDDLRQQFAEHVPGGIKIFEEVARRLGYKTLEDLRDDFKAGKVSAAELNAEFIKMGNSPKYLQGATEAAQTLGGTWQAFTEEIQSTVGMAFDRNRKEIIDAINGIRPVVMGFIEGLVARLPKMIDWLGRLVTKAREIKAAYDNLSPAGKELIQQVTLVGLAAGPAAIAIGILGTALSGVANSASLAMKTLSLIGAPITAMGGWVMFAVVAITALVAAIGVLYNKSEGVRTGVLRAFNLIKDFVASVFLPVLDLLIGTVQSVWNSLQMLGLKSEHLGYILLLLAAPILGVVQAMLALVAVIKVVHAVVLIVLSIVQALLQTIGFLILGFRELFELLAKIPGAPDAFKKIAESADRSGKKLIEMIDVSKGWKTWAQTNSNATDGWQSSLNNLDFTTTGLTGAFGGWNNILDQTISKQFSLTEAVNNARAAMDGQAASARSLTDASDNFNKAEIALKDSIQQNGRTLNEKTKQGQANRDMLKQATQASYEMMLQDIRSGVPMDQAIKRHKDRTNALKDEFGKNKETRAEADKLIASYGKVPKDVETLLKLIGWDGTAAKLQEILAAQKVAANPGMSYSKALQAERKAWQTRNFAYGGEAKGPGGPRADKIPAMVSDGEYILQNPSVKRLKKQFGRNFLNYLNTFGTLPPQFARGGPVTWPMNVDISKTRFPEILGGSPGGGGMGWQRMMAVLRQKFPGLPLISGYRPGAVTSTGNRSYHALGRAVDLPPRWDIFNWISQNYGRGTKELIYTPAGGRQIKNGNFHRFTGGTIAEDHYDHVHWAYDNGGQIAPNTPFINKTGVNELALNSAQGKALEDKIRNSDRPVHVTVYVDGVKRDAEIVFDERIDDVIAALGGA